MGGTLLGVVIITYSVPTSKICTLRYLGKKVMLLIEA